MKPPAVSYVLPGRRTLADRLALAQQVAEQQGRQAGRQIRLGKARRARSRKR